MGMSLVYTSVRIMSKQCPYVMSNVHKLLCIITPRVLNVEDVVTLHPSRYKVYLKSFCVQVFGLISNISFTYIIQSVIYLTYSVNLDHFENFIWS